MESLMFLIYLEPKKTTNFGSQDLRPSLKII
jgi:hypothetical protein